MNNMKNNKVKVIKEFPGIPVGTELTLNNGKYEYENNSHDTIVDFDYESYKSTSTSISLSSDTVKTYLGDLTGDSIQELLNELKSLPDKFKEFWHKNVGFMESVVNFLLKTYELEGIDLPDIRQDEKRLTETINNKKSPLAMDIEKALGDKLANVYKELL